MKIDKSWYKKPNSKNFPKLNMAGGIVVRKEGRKLLIALVGDKRYTTFNLPKGKVEKGETFFEAAKREIEEELGLNRIKLIKKLAVLERYTFKKTSWNSYHYYLFLTDQKSGVQKLMPSERHFYLKWVELAKLPEFYWPEQERLVLERRHDIIMSMGGD